MNEIILGTTHFREANEIVRAALAASDELLLSEVYAQRYLGCTMPEGKRLEIVGTPGNDLACYMDGGVIEVFGSGQDQVANTMNAGLVVVHGRVGDAAGYAMRGGELFVRDGCGWRAGINMKQYGGKCPTLVIGGDAGNFLGEYMAGGIVVLLGQPGEHLASGMHGGVIYLRRDNLPADLPTGVMADELTTEDALALAELLGRYDGYFEGEPHAIWDLADMVALRPASSRPYAAMYAS